MRKHVGYLIIIAWVFASVHGVSTAYGDGVSNDWDKFGLFILSLYAIYPGIFVLLGIVHRALRLQIWSTAIYVIIMLSLIVVEVAVIYSADMLFGRNGNFIFAPYLCILGAMYYVGCLMVFIFRRLFNK